MNDSQVTCTEHLKWCQSRALELLDQGDVVGAWTSMLSDMSKHPETRAHERLKLGQLLMMSGAGAREMREFIETFTVQPAEKPAMEAEMNAAGFTWDPSHQGYARWTHMTAGVTALRQPYMSDQQWDEHQQKKIAEAQEKLRQQPAV